ncbi:transcription-repair-coupling factor [Tanacetum coccineum]
MEDVCLLASLGIIYLTKDSRKASRKVPRAIGQVHVKVPSIPEGSSVPIDYVYIQYADGVAKLPVKQASKFLYRYNLPNESSAPRGLGRLKDTSVWEKRKVKGKVAIQKYGLLNLLDGVYLNRLRLRRPPYPKNPAMAEFAAQFPYKPTPDQLQAFIDVDKDLTERETPMDRLICGDVGFGKTEVAQRALFCVVSSGKQAMVLAPTIVLARQHFGVISERFSRYPNIRVGLMSRFQTRTEREEYFHLIQNGELDIIIGTHSLLGSRVTYDKLGLLIVDEEQRFGVKQKEMIASFKTSVDVLTLSATPIPRTLYLALTGFPPPQEVPIKNPSLELVGKGLEQVMAFLEKTFPDVEIALAHGQKRLTALEECGDLGQGLQLAERDMTIRGFGNIFGVQQTGDVGNVGIDLFFEMLFESLSMVDVHRTRPVPYKSVKLELDINPRLSSEYINYLDNPIEVVKDAEKAATKDMWSLVQFTVDLRRQYGKEPYAMEVLLKKLCVKRMAADIGISKIYISGKTVIMTTNMSEQVFKMIRDAMLSDIHRNMLEFLGDEIKAELLIDLPKDQLLSWIFQFSHFLAALGSVQFVSNIAFAYVVLNKTVTVKVVVATTFIVLGNTFLVAFGNHQSPGEENGYSLCQERIFRLWANYLNSISYAVVSGAIGSCSVLFAKSLSNLLRLSMSSSYRLDSWFTYSILLLFLCTAGFWMARLNEGLAQFDAILIVPMFQIAWTFFSIITGFVYFQEYQVMDILRTVMFILGMISVFIGISLLAPDEPKGEAKDSSLSSATLPRVNTEVERLIKPIEDSPIKDLKSFMRALAAKASAAVTRAKSTCTLLLGMGDDAMHGSSVFAMPMVSSKMTGFRGVGGDRSKLMSLRSPTGWSRIPVVEESVNMLETTSSGED